MLFYSLLSTYYLTCAAVFCPMRGILKGFKGATENVGVENAKASKMQECKTREWKSWHQNTGVENAREASMESQNSTNQNFSFTKLVVDHRK